MTQHRELRGEPEIPDVAWQGGLTADSDQAWGDCAKTCGAHTAGMRTGWGPQKTLTWYSQGSWHCHRSIGKAEQGRRQMGMMPQRGPERQSVEPADHSDGHKGEAPALRTPNLHYYPFTRHHSQSLLNKASSYHGKTWEGWMLAVQRQGLVGKGQEAPCDTLTQQTKFSNIIKGRDICTQVWIRVWWYIPGLHWRDFYLQSLMWWNKGKYWGTDTTWGSVKGRIFQRAAVLEQPHYQGQPGPEKSCPRWRLTAGLCPEDYQNGLKNINHMIMIIPIDVKGPWVTSNSLSWYVMKETMNRHNTCQHNKGYIQQTYN